MLIGLTTKAQWNQILTGQGSLINGISVVNDNVVWVKDQLNTSISITTDGGATWVTKPFPVAMKGKVGGFSAVSSTTAYLILSMASTPYVQGVYKTTDSGNSWEKQTTGFNASSAFPDIVHFWNENDGVAMGDPDSNFEIYTTNNGGVQWNLVSPANIPLSTNEWSYNANGAYKVVGNSIYFQTSTGRIFKSANKGLQWTVITTPITSGDKMSFDFKDDNNGLLSNYVTSTGLYSLYSTNSGGASWTKIESTSPISDLKYIPSKSIYISTNSNNGLEYSSDNGLTWTAHSSFVKTGLRAVAVNPSGKIFMGGWGYLYSSTNHSGLNLSVSQAQLINSKTIDITFSGNLDVISAQDTANYVINHRLIKNASNAWIYNRIQVSSVKIDNTNKSLVHITTVSDLPYDTIYTNIFNVKGLDGFPVINKSNSSFSSVINKSNLTNYATTKLGLIGSSYYLDNVKGGTKAGWNVCWKDVANNVQASVPTISGNGLIYTWSFPAVYLDGTISASNPGMFKFCIPNIDNTPDWGKMTIGYPQVSGYNGNAIADIDRTTDGGGAFSVLTGLIKKYNLKLIIDQTTGVDVITLVSNYDVKNYSTTKLALIGNSYFLDNVKSGTKANWNICWKDVVNNVQASVPTISGNGLINTWNFPNVYLDGANQGMFKFCVPNIDNTPDWSNTIFGYPQIGTYTGNATADLDKITDAGGAFIILTSGLINKYNIKLIIDQTTGIEKVLLNMDNANFTSLPHTDETETIIAEYKIFTLQGAMILSDAANNRGLKLENIKANLPKGVYLIKAKLTNGESRNYKVIAQ